MAAPTSTRRNAVILVLLLFLQLVLMASSARRGPESRQLESWTLSLTAPVVDVSHFVADGVHDTVAGVADLLAAHARNRALEREIDTLRRELVRHREAAGENERLRHLLTMREQLIPHSVGADVVSSVGTVQTRLLIVNRGSKDGVRLDRPVVAWGGAVGRVVAHGPRDSKVQLLTDPNSEVGAIVQRSRAQGLVEGSGGDTLMLRYVPGFADVVAGDRVVTSGLAGIFPAGFEIGEVVRVEDAPDGSRTIEVRPALDYADLEEVLVVLDPRGSALLEEGVQTPPDDALDDAPDDTEGGEEAR